MSDTRKSAKCGKCKKQVEECKCLGNGDHPWDCECTRCKRLENGGSFN